MSVCERDGTFRPLDQRVIHRLHEMDTHRQNYGRQSKSISNTVDRQLRDEQGRQDAMKRNAEDEQFAEAFDRASFEFNRLERKGKI